MKCILCGSADLQTVDTVVSDFVMARILPKFRNRRVPNYKTKLCFCRRCTFAFYDYRMSDKEDQLLYQNYRTDEYQKLREKYECWYTKKVNDAQNSDFRKEREQRKRIETMFFRNIDHEPKIALDYGGYEGKSFTPRLGTKGKYVYDISGVETIEGVQRIANYEELKSYSFDFIMCNGVFEHLVDPMDMMKRFKEIGNQKTIYYIEVPSENPFLKGNKFTIAKNFKLLFNPIYSNIRLVRYYFQQRKMPFMPMKEHINFFTKESIKGMVEQTGFRTLDVQEVENHTALGTSTVISILFVQDA